MTTVFHLVDDATLGGVTRTLALVEARLGEGFHHQQVTIAPGASRVRLPGPGLVCVHLSSSWARLPLLAGLRLRRRAVAIVEHTYTRAFERLEVPSRLRFRTMLRAAYGLADRVVAVSDAQAAWLRDARLAPSSRIVTVKPASACDHLLALPPPAPRSGPLRLGAMGRLSREKGFDLLLEAMRLVPPGLATLELAGAGPEEAALRRTASGIDGVAFAGAVRDHARWLSGIDAIVVPSRRESFGLVPLEARMAARPLIASAVDGLPEQLRDGGGLLVEPESPSALADAIVRLRALDLAAIGAAGRRSAAGHPAATAAGWHQLLAGLASATPPGALAVPAPRIAARS